MHEPFTRDCPKYTYFLLVFLAVMTVIPLLQTGFTTADDWSLALQAEGGAGAPIAGTGTNGALADLAMRVVAPVAYGFGHYWLSKLLGLAAILSNVLVLFLLVRVMTESRRLAPLAVTLCLAGLANGPHSLLTAHPVVTPLALSGFLIAIAAWWQALQGCNTHARRGLVLFALSALLQSIFAWGALLFPLLTLMGSSGTRADRFRRAVRSPHLAIGAGYLLLSAAIGAFWSPARSGAAADPLAFDAAETFWRVILSSTPLAFLSASEGIIRDHYLGFGDFGGRVLDIFSVVRTAWIARALVAALLVVQLCHPHGTWKHRGVVLTTGMWLLLVTSGLAAAAYTAPPATLAAIVGVSAYVGFFGVVLVLTLGAAGLAQALERVAPPGGRAVAILVGAAVFVVSYGTDFVNAHIGLAQQRMFDRHRAVEAFLRSDAFGRIPVGSVIVAPSLFDGPDGPSSLDADYWTRYIGTRAGRDVRVLATPDVWASAVHAGDARLYYVKLQQEARDRTLMLVVAQVTAEDTGELSARELAIMTHGLSREPRISGRLVSAFCREHVLVDGVPTRGTFTRRFFAQVKRKREQEEWLWTHISSGRARVDADSIVVSQYAEEVDGGGVAISFDSGFHEPDGAQRWADERATMTLENRSDREMSLTLSFALATPGASDGVIDVSTGAGAERWHTGAEPSRQSLRLHLPPRSRSPVTFSTTAAPVAGTVDLYRRVMRFEDLRAEEDECGGATGP